MSTESIIKHVTPAGGNIFSDLGFEPDEAEKLLVETDAIIAEKLAIQLKGSSQKAEKIVPE